MRFVDVDQLMAAISDMDICDRYYLMKVIKNLPTFSEDDISVTHGAWITKSDSFEVCSGIVCLHNGNPDWTEIRVRKVYEGRFDSKDNLWCVGKEITKYIFNPKRDEIYIDPSQDCESVIVLYEVFDTSAKVTEVKCNGSSGID